MTPTEKSPKGKHATPTPKELRSFGVGVGTITAVLCLLGFWKESYEIGMVRMLFLFLAADLIFFGVVAPWILAVPYRLWMALAGLMNRIMTPLLLTVFFFLAMTPVGLLMRVFSRKGFQERPKPAGESYWRSPDPDPRGRERYEQPF